MILQSDPALMAYQVAVPCAGEGGGVAVDTAGGLNPGPIGMGHPPLPQGYNQAAHSGLESGFLAAGTLGQGAC